MNRKQMKQHNNIPQLRFPEFDGEWEDLVLSRVFSFFNGYAFKSSDSRKDGCRWVKIADVGINELNPDNSSYLPENYKDKYPKFLLKKGDYVVALTRPILGGKLKIAQISEEYNNSLLNQRVARIDSMQNIAFVYQLLQQRRLISKIENRIAGTDPPNLSQNEINGIKVSIPTPPRTTKNRPIPHRR